MIIVVAWTEEGREITKIGDQSLGEMHEFRAVRVPYACIWKNDGSEEDLEKAQVHAVKQGWTVYTFADSCADPLGDARKKIVVKDAPIEPSKPKMKQCSKCRGNGVRGRKYKSTCFVCNGLGEVTIFDRPRNKP